MIAWFARRDVAANLLMVSLLMSGFVALKTSIPLEIFPDLQLDIVNVNVALRGASPEDVEQGVAIRVEEAVQDLEGVRRLTSVSSEGAASISIEVEPGDDPVILLDEVKTRVDALNTLPVDAEKPVIELAQRKREVISVVVAGDYSERELREIAETTRDDLLRLPGITHADLGGVRAYEIAVEVSQDRLREYELSLDDIATAIQASSLDLAAGNLRAAGGEVLVRSTGQAYRRDEFENIVVKTNADGTILRIGDIARVHDGFEETSIRTRFNGEPAALVEVYRVGKQSAIAVADSVRDYIDARQDSLPVGLTLTYYDDDSRIVKSRLRTLITNALQGGILVIALLALFLKPAVAFWVFVGIPISFMGAFLVMAITGTSINVLSLFGFILVLGIVVDDAIVTGENVYTHLRRGRPGLDAAIDGTREVAIPVTFGVLTTVAAFAPLSFIEGHRAILFAQIPVVVIPVLLFSLIESKFVLPAHLKHVRLGDAHNASRLSRLQQSFATGFEHAILRYYGPLIDRSLRYRYTTIAVFLAGLIVVLAAVMSGWTHFVFFPRVEGETARATLVMPAGTPFSVTDAHVARIADAAAAIRDEYTDSDDTSLITNIYASSGSGGGGESAQNNLGRVEFQVVAPEDRSGADTPTMNDLVNAWRERIGEIPGAEELNFRAEIGRTSSPVDIRLSGHDLDLLKRLAAQIKERLSLHPGIVDITDSQSSGKQEMRIELNAVGHALGLTRADVIRQVRQAYFGAQAQRIQRGRDDLRVFVRLPMAERTSLRGLEDFEIVTATGQRIPLSHVADLEPGISPSRITRVDRYRTLNVSADVDKATVNMTVLTQELAAFLAEITAPYPEVNYEFEGEAREQRESFGSLKVGLLALLFVIYALLAIPFNSFVQPLIVMSVIPFGLIGAVIGHWLLGMDLTIMSVFGLLALSGVVVNDSLVLVQFINQQRGTDTTSLMASVKAAGVARFRPVMLTSLTTFIGLAPLLLEKATQAQFLIPMAVSLGFGIIFATFVTLILVPVNYIVLEDLRRGWDRLRGGEIRTAGKT